MADTMRTVVLDSPGPWRTSALATPVAAHVLYVAEGVTVDVLPSDIAEWVAP